MPFAVRLTPYDRFFLASHRLQQRSGLPGHNCLARLDLTGTLDPDGLRDALTAAILACPRTAAAVRFSLPTARAYWWVDPTHARAAARAALTIYDLADPPPDHAARVEHGVLLREWRDPFDPAIPPQFRLYLFKHAAGRSAVVLRWPHHLMDLEGAQMFLARVAARPDAPPDASAPVARLDDPPAWSRRRAARLIQGLKLVRACRDLNSARLIETDAPGPLSADFLFRHYSPDDARRIADTARRHRRPGPMLHTRHLAVAVLRALDDARDILALEGETYVLPLPLLRPRQSPRAVVEANDLTIAALVVPRRLLARPAELDDALVRQLHDWAAAGHDAAHWRTLAFAGLLRINHYEWMLRRCRVIPPWTVGLASYRAPAGLETFLGCRVANFSSCGLPTIPPGLMLTFVRFGDRLNLGAAYFHHLCAPTQLAHFLDRLETHLGLESPRAPHPIARALAPARPAPDS